MNKTIKRKVSKRIVLGKSLLDQAGIGEEIEIIIQEGVILILPAVKSKGWEILESLGEDATEGVLENPSEQHDNYIYGGKR